MKKNLSRVLSLLLILAMMVSVIPFALAEGTTPPEEQPIIGTATIEGETNLTLKNGSATTTLKAHADDPAEGYMVSSYKWTGNVNGGNELVTFTATEAKEYDVSVEITYKNAEDKTAVYTGSTKITVAPDASTVYAKSIQITPIDDMVIGATAPVTVTTDPAGLEYTWVVTGDAVQMVDEHTIKAVKEGSSQIIATAKDLDEDGHEVLNQITVKVTNGKITCDSIDVAMGATGKLTASVDGLSKEAQKTVKYTFTPGGDTGVEGDVNVVGVTGNVATVKGTNDGVAAVKVKAEYTLNGDKLTAETVAYVGVYDEHDASVTLKNSGKAFDFEDTNVFSSVEKDGYKYDKDDCEDQYSDLAHILVEDDASKLVIERYSASGSDTVGSFNTYSCAWGALSNMKFTPNGKSGTQIVYYTIYGPKDRVVAEGTLSITTGASAGDISYETSFDEDVTFSKTDFETFWKENKERSYGSLSYVTFDVDSDVPEYGELYTTTSKTSKVSKREDYSTTDLSKITYEPDKYEDDEEYTVSIPFTAWDSKDNYVDGVVTIEVGDGEGDITYETEKNKKVTFDEDDFEEFWDDVSERGDGDLDYVKFTASPKYGKLHPSASSTSSVYTSDKFYFDASSGQKDLNTVTYEPQSNKDDYTVEIPFTAYGEDDGEYKGVVVVKVGETANGDTISSRGVVFGTAKVTKALEDAYEDETDGELEYVTFELPDVETGKLYYDFDGILNSDLVDDDEKYYVDPGKNELDLDKVCFIPAAGTKGKVTIEYTAYGDEGEEEFELTFNVALKNKSVKFNDVKPGSYDWAADGIDFMYYEGVVKGTNSANTLYSPANNISRGDFMLMLYRAFLKDEYEDETVTENFSDVKKGTSDYSKETYQAVGIAKELGIAKGNGGKFNPTASITREEAMALIYRTLDEMDIELEYDSNKSTSSFTDYSKVSAWAKDAISDLIDHGIVVGSSGKISPKSNITRAEMAVILHRVLTY